MGVVVAAALTEQGRGNMQQGRKGMPLFSSYCVDCSAPLFFSPFSSAYVQHFSLSLSLSLRHARPSLYTRGKTEFVRHFFLCSRRCWRLGPPQKSGLFFPCSFFVTTTLMGCLSLSLSVFVAPKHVMTKTRNLSTNTKSPSSSSFLSSPPQRE